MSSEESSTEQLRRAAALCRELYAGLCRTCGVHNHQLMSNLLDRSSGACKSEADVLKKDIFVAAQALGLSAYMNVGVDAWHAMIPTELKAPEFGRVLYEVSPYLARVCGFEPMQEITEIAALFKTFMADLDRHAGGKIGAYPANIGLNYSWREEEIAFHEQEAADPAATAAARESAQRHIERERFSLAKNILSDSAKALDLAREHVSRSEMIALLPEGLTTPENLKALEVQVERDHKAISLLSYCEDKLKVPIAQKDLERVAGLCQAFAEALDKEWGGKISASAQAASIDALMEKNPELKEIVERLYGRETDLEKQFRLAAKPVREASAFVDIAMKEHYLRAKIATLMPVALKGPEAARILHEVVPGSHIANFAGPAPLSAYKQAVRKFYK